MIPQWVNDYLKANRQVKSKRFQCAVIQANVKILEISEFML